MILLKEFYKHEGIKVTVSLYGLGIKTKPFFNKETYENVYALKQENVDDMSLHKIIPKHSTSKELLEEHPAYLYVGKINGRLCILDMDGVFFITDEFLEKVIKCDVVK